MDTLYSARFTYTVQGKRKFFLDITEFSLPPLYAIFNLQKVDRTE